MKLPYADEINYFKTSKSSPDIWMDKAMCQIENLGGQVLTHAFGQDSGSGTAAYLMIFKIGGQEYKTVWPVLPVENEKDQLAARRQCATLLYHDIKAKCLSATVKGARRAFFEYLKLPDGRTTSELADDEILEIPSIFKDFGKLQLQEK